ncbi:MAG: hypothetical protein A3E78_16080 [Alphaproteobacteria bacterium RIFCSPHIGHO2_12_FULL_63_12]|nr:MAG: hypothetical protein A3E78_16080 [Alphaproteobacteria bacterium RIFCSPHIGHO2_12_FULL_63_12]
MAACSASERDAKKWELVFCKAARQIKKLAHNADSGFAHFALTRRAQKVETGFAQKEALK